MTHETPEAESSTERIRRTGDFIEAHDLESMAVNDDVHLPENGGEIEGDTAQSLEDSRLLGMCSVPSLLLYNDAPSSLRHQPTTAERRDTFC